MDISNFDARTAANDEQRMHLRHPATGELLYDGDDLGKPCVVLVRGTESRDVQKKLRALNQSKMKGSKNETDRILADTHEELARTMVPLIVGFENIDRGGKPLEATPADIEWFLNLQLIGLQRDGDDDKADDLSFLGQVAKFASDRENYLGNGSTG